MAQNTKTEDLHSKALKKTSKKSKVGNGSIPYISTEQEYDHKDIAYRLSKKAFVSEKEGASLIATYHQCFLAFAIANNLANVNDVLRHENGFGELPFMPNQKLVEAQVDLLLTKGHEAALQDVINKFVFNPNANNWTTQPELVAELKRLNIIK